MDKVKCEYTELVDIHKLTPHPKNPNKHPEEQIKRLSEIIDYQGMRSPIVVSKMSGFITKGHGRLSSLKLLGWEKVPVDYQDYDDEAQEYADIVADNAIAEWAAQDLSEINIEMLELGPDFDIDLLGIKDFVIEPIEKYDEEKEDDVPDVKHEPITKRGDVWLLGNHKVMCGDSTMIDDVDKLMKDGKADMVFTDPPYGISYQSNMRTKSDRFEELKNDDTILDIAPIIDMFSVGFVFVWSTWKVLDRWIEPLSSLGKMTNMIVWSKGGGGIGDLKKTFSTDWELALVYNRGAELKGKRIGSVWSIGKDKAIDYKHPTQKPVALAEEALDKCSKSGYVVMDLFLGSGSTLIACEKTNRKCYGMELDEHYCDVIVERWQKYTGKKATLESTGDLYAES